MRVTAHNIIPSDIADKRAYRGAWAADVARREPSLYAKAKALAHCLKRDNPEGGIHTEPALDERGEGLSRAEKNWLCILSHCLAQKGWAANLGYKVQDNGRLKLSIVYNPRES